MKKIVIFIVVAFLLVGCSIGSSFNSITGDEAIALIHEKQAIIIDVRSNQEYDSGHIKDSINIPVDTIELELLEQFIFDKTNNIIVYCRSGNRSNTAAQLLVDLGYTNVYDLGSIDNWNGEIE